MKISHKVVKNSKIGYNDIQYTDITAFTYKDKIIKVVVPFTATTFNCYGNENTWNGIIEVELEKAPEGQYKKIIIGRTCGKDTYFWGVSPEYLGSVVATTYLIDSITDLSPVIRKAYSAAAEYAKTKFKFDKYTLGSCLNESLSSISYSESLVVGGKNNYCDITYSDLKYLYEVDDDLVLKKTTNYDESIQIVKCGNTLKIEIEEN